MFRGRCYSMLQNCLSENQYIQKNCKGKATLFYLIQLQKLFFSPTLLTNYPFIFNLFFFPPSLSVHTVFFFFPIQNHRFLLVPYSSSLLHSPSFSSFRFCLSPLRCSYSHQLCIQWLLLLWSECCCLPNVQDVMRCFNFWRNRSCDSPFQQTYSS